MTRPLDPPSRAADHQSMASLPSLPTLGLRRPADDLRASRLAGEVDAKLQLARRLRDEDHARRTTSVAPPSTPLPRA